MALNAIIPGPRFVLTMKDEGTPQQIWRTSLVVQGHEDEMEQHLVHSVALSRQISTKTMLSIADILKFKPFLADGT